jgi:hypothetical protein
MNNKSVTRTRIKLRDFREEDHKLFPGAVPPSRNVKPKIYYGTFIGCFTHYTVVVDKHKIQVIFTDNEAQVTILSKSAIDFTTDPCIKIDFNDLVSFVENHFYDETISIEYLLMIGFTEL